MDSVGQFASGSGASSAFTDYAQYTNADEQYLQSLEYEAGSLANSICPPPPTYTAYAASPGANGMEYVHNLYTLHYPGGELQAGLSENLPFGARAIMTSDGKRKRRRIITLEQRKAANIRERRRMFHLNEAFDQLRKRVPTFAYEKKLSRIETLKLAVTYIEFMSEMLHGGVKDGSHTPSSNSSTDLQYMDENSFDGQSPMADSGTRLNYMSDPSSPEKQDQAENLVVPRS